MKRFLLFIIFLIIFSFFTAISFQLNSDSNKINFLPTLIFIGGIASSFYVTNKIGDIADKRKIKVIIIEFITKRKLMAYVKKINKNETISKIFNNDKELYFFINKTCKFIKCNNIEKSLSSIEIKSVSIKLFSSMIYDEIIYNGHFAYRGMPIFETCYHIKVYIKMMEYMRCNNIISEDQKKFAIATLKKDVSEMG